MFFHAKDVASGRMFEPARIMAMPAALPSDCVNLDFAGKFVVSP